MDQVQEELNDWNINNIIVPDKGVIPNFDNLTGLLSHGSFLVKLEQESNRYKRYGGSFTLGLIDIDEFTLFNEKNSYEKGDAVLRKVAEIIRSNIRENDFAGRYSGNQFIILISEIDIKSSLAVTERIRRLVEVSTNSTLSVSIGLVSYPNDADNRFSLIEKARAALREAKLRGKNNIYFFDHNASLETHKNPTILIVDDSINSLKLIETVLARDYQLLKAQGGEQALYILSEYQVDLIILDVMMPGMDGFTVCQKIKNNKSLRMIPVIMLTSLDDSSSRVRGIEAGADDFISKPPSKEELLARAKSLVRMKKLNENLTDIKNVMLSLANAVESKDAYTQGHVQRVANLAMSVGKKMDLSAEDIDYLWYAGVLHDVGKVGIPHHILNKEGPLNDDEQQIIKTHPIIGYNICLPLMNTLGPALGAIRHHHEKLDGSGYPDGLKGDAISVHARIISVVDIYDALTSARAYRRGLSVARASTILRREADQGKIDKRIFEHLQDII
jgi:putative two-component system response regulator